ncbi:DUF488 domain-containing protein [Archangium violaceum]|uniref:DUF488 domain-containing protein n=1 Tax=Archangium violaceum TaxID=83451 RepID=UPI00194FA3D6|nr:DUF488 domain-containing protein [Archangium violaceum]QRN99580.1 DUF488 domain-containing protein [Archangium violaceum]
MGTKRGTEQRKRKAPGWGKADIYTVGHSTRSAEELVELLRAHGIRTLVDIRTVPRSRTNPQFNQDTLPKTLAKEDIHYVHLPRLGGLRRAHKDSPNSAWRNASFRGYADYMQTDEFARGLEELRELTPDGPLALMCAEAVRWRCHRSLVADALYARGVVARHITSRTRAAPHELTPFAVLHGREVLYPGGEPEPSETLRAREPERRGHEAPSGR